MISFVRIAVSRLAVLIVLSLGVAPHLPARQRPSDEGSIPVEPDSLRRLAITNYTSNRPDEALEAFRRMVRSLHDLIETTSPTLSDGERLRLLQRHPPIDGAFLSFALESHSPSAMESALEMVLWGKEMRVDLFAAEGVDTVEDRHFEIREIADALPEGSVLWEFVEFSPYDFERADADAREAGNRGSGGEGGGSSAQGPGSDGQLPSPSPSSPPHYVAFTLERTGKIGLVDLGAAAKIDSLVAEARRTIEGAGEVLHSKEIEKSGRRLDTITAALYGRIFVPLKPSLGEARTILIAPDGRLNLLPFEILPLPGGKYVIESYRVSYLCSGRDLASFGKEREHPDWAIVMAGPNFDLSGKALARRRDRLMNQSGAFTLAYAPSRGASECLVGRFVPLRQADFESNTVALLLEERGGMKVDDYLGGEAMEEVLKMMRKPPRVLHMLTRGYFCGEQPSAKEGGWLENPLLRSGLALSGANRMIDNRGVLIGEGEDGILTAYEVSGLDLSGTEAVVLSACDAGVGDTGSGESVFGLRRAFRHAGAESVVMSLWKIPNRESFRIMERFYKNWLGGQGKREALRQSVLDVIANLRKRHGTAHPFLWGGFILAGDPN